MLHNTRHIHKGFGLIEALVASGIVAMLAAGSVALSATILNNTRTSYDQLVGTRLAMQAIEGARWIRDRNISDGNKGANNADVITDWNTLRSLDTDTAGNPVSTCNTCILDPVIPTSASGVYYANFDSQVITVQATPSSVAHIFERKISIDIDPLVPDIMTITVTVDKKRPDGSSPRVANISTQLTNWK